MKTLEAQEIAKRINEILQMLKEGGETVEIIDEGEIIAHLVPANSFSRHSIKQDHAIFLNMLNRHAREIGKHMGQESVNAVDIIREGRREL